MRAHSGHFGLIVALFFLPGLSRCGGNRTTMGRPWAKASNRSLLVVLTAPKTMFAARSASVSAFLRNGAACAIGASERFSSVATAVPLAGLRKKDVGFTAAHGFVLPMLVVRTGGRLYILSLGICGWVQLNSVGHGKFDFSTKTRPSGEKCHVSLSQSLRTVRYWAAMWSRSFVALATVVVVVASTLLGTVHEAPPVHAQFFTEVDDPALFDLDLAQARLDELRLEADRLAAELDNVLGLIDGLTIERDSIALNDQGRNQQMQESRTRARNMAINAYIGIGAPLSGLVIFDAKSANDLSYRNGLLRQQAERLQIAAQTYAHLAGQADENALVLGDAINDEVRVAEALSRALARVVDQIPYAEWVVSIAEIHRLADESFAESQRREPTPEQWRQLRFCESTETYNIDTGNTFYGAYQFTWETWGTVGGIDNPAHAPPAEQDARARLLYSRRGSQPWPICGRFLP